MRINENQIEGRVKSDPHNPEAALRHWISEYQRLERNTRQQIQEMDIEMEVMRELIQVTTRLLEQAVGKDVDILVMEQMANQMKQSNDRGLH